MLQNRVDPLGNLITTAARGNWTGTRGVLHNEQPQIVRPFKLKAWLTCKLEFKGRKRKVMSPDRYTELFFLDEATALAAGHRPCCECRREDFNRFKSLWLKGNPQYNFDGKVAIKKIDAVIHKERIDRNKSKVTFEESIHIIPNGSFVLVNDQPFLLFTGQLFLWSPYGYGQPIELPGTDKLTVLTPRSILNTLRQGYRPQIAMLHL